MILYIVPLFIPCYSYVYTKVMLQVARYICSFSNVCANIHILYTLIPIDFHFVSPVYLRRVDLRP